MKTAARFILAAATLWASCTALAFAYEIRFQDGYVGNGQLIAQDYGSVPGVVNVRIENLNGDALQFWQDLEYSGRPAAFADSTTSVGMITFTPLGGRTVTLDSFFLGAWPNSDRSIDYSIDDLETPGAPDILVTGNTVSGATGLTVTPALSSATGIRISFGPDGHNGGINNIVFSVTAVPEPESWALMLAGMGLVGAVVRRRGTQRRLG